MEDIRRLIATPVAGLICSTYGNISKPAFWVTGIISPGVVTTNWYLPVVKVFAG